MLFENRTKTEKGFAPSPWLGHARPRPSAAGGPAWRPGAHARRGASIPHASPRSCIRATPRRDHGEPVTALRTHRGRAKCAMDCALTGVATHPRPPPCCRVAIHSAHDGCPTVTTVPFLARRKAHGWLVGPRMPLRSTQGYLAVPASSEPALRCARRWQAKLPAGLFTGEFMREQEGGTIVVRSMLAPSTSFFVAHRWQLS